VKKPDVEVQGWCGYRWSAVVRSSERTVIFAKTISQAAYGREMNINYQAKALVDILAVSKPIAHLFKT
jgi:hypothetical protein